jgi:mannose-6-phosphate isomerase-like protein (cupin superfamily)
LNQEKRPRETVRLQSACLTIDPSEVEAFDRGGGVATIPYIGVWNSDLSTFTTGVTRFAVGTGLPLHLHNVEESVLVFSGLATAEIDGVLLDLEPGQATWVPAGVPHRFFNRGDSEMSIYWIYGGRHVTRTIIATGETFEHLSASDRGGASTRP